MRIGFCQPSVLVTDGARPTEVPSRHVQSPRYLGGGLGYTQSLPNIDHVYTRQVVGVGDRPRRCAKLHSN